MHRKELDFQELNALLEDESPGKSKNWNLAKCQTSFLILENRPFGKFRCS